MPTNIKIILTILVAIGTWLMYQYEISISNEPVQLYVAGLGCFMILALWLFPEAGKRPGE